MTEKHRINVGDAELYVEFTGDGPDLFLVSGLGGRGAFWSNQLEALSAHFRVITHDHRGCGGSSPGKIVSSVGHMANDLIAIMDATGIEKAHLVGHSTGGAIGQYIALKWPERLDKLVLSCSWAGPDAYFEQLFAVRRQILIDCGPTAYLTIGTYLAMPSLYLQPEMKVARAFMEQRLKAFPGLEVELSRIAAVVSHDLRREIPKIGHRTLCIGARDDQITPPGFAEELASLIQGAQLHLLDRGGHFCPVVSADAYNARLLEFLKA